LKWAEDALNELDQTELGQSKKDENIQATALKSVQDELRELLRMRTRGIIDDAEYAEQKKFLVDEIESHKSKLAALNSNSATSAKETINSLKFIQKAQKKFEDGTIDERKELITMFGQKLDLLDRKLTFTPVSWLIPIQKHYPDLERQFLALEPRKPNSSLMLESKKTPVGSSAVLSENRQTLGLNSLNSTWLRQLGSNQRPNR
jgi:hypothetical protein